MNATIRSRMRRDGERESDIAQMQSDRGLGSAISWFQSMNSLSDRVQTVGQRRRAGLKDQRRLDLDDAAVAHGRDHAPSGPLRDPFRPHLLAAPRGEDGVGRGGDDGFGRDDAILCFLLAREMRKDILAAGNADQFRHPADATDQRIVPFLEIDFWTRQPMRRGGSRAKPILVASGQLLGLVCCAHQSADGLDHRQNAGDIALIEGVDGDAGPDQLGRDLRLKIGEGGDEVGFEREDGMSAEVKADTRGFSRLTFGGRTA